MPKARIDTTEFTPGERAYVRGELDQFMSTLPTVAEGFMLKTWDAARMRASQSCRRPRKAWSSGG